MKTLLTLFLMTLFAVSLRTVAADPLPVPIPGWDSAGKPSGWTFTDPGHVSIVHTSEDGEFVEVSLPFDASNSTTGAQVDLPIDKVRGTVIEVSIEARAKDVSKPLSHYNGVKAQVNVVNPAQFDTFPRAYDANGDVYPVSYDWKRLTFQARIPPTAAKAVLTLGLQDSTGTVDFRSVSAAILRTAAMAPLVPPAGPVFTGHAPGMLRGVMINPFIKPGDVDTLKQWHVNVVRWQLKPESNAGLEVFDRSLDAQLKHLDEMLPVFKKAGILVVLDLHRAIGKDALFHDASVQRHFTECWATMAAKYRGEKQIWGYDLLNEPTPAKGPGAVVAKLPNGVLDWRELAGVTAQRVRAIDPDHAIIVEPDPVALLDGLPFFKPLNVSGVVYSVHMYEPFYYTHQGVKDGILIGPVYPGNVGGVEWNKNQIRKEFQPIADYARTFHVAVYVGEFSAVRWAKGADRYVNDVIDVMEEDHFDWTYHAFREWQGWNPEIGEEKNVTTPSLQPTARLTVLKHAFERNARPLAE
ncbi:MAG: cellulase family glycosylhydrolase [Capsulimonadaceae bacterium]|nr:cellulase family glycosylhydrolase [Capsulimonadaceae bacterium]